MDAGPTRLRSEAAEGTDEDGDEDMDEDKDEEDAEDEDGKAGCFVGQPKAQEQQTNHSGGVDGWAPPPSSVITTPPPPPPPPPPAKPSCKRQNCGLHHHHHHQKSVSSDRDGSRVEADAVHIQEVAGDDCCLHCVLACLFCELLSMCAVLGDCLSCGLDGAACCQAALGCCGCLGTAGETVCSEDACQALLDCGLLGDCCGSSDCLEICLECCSICFPS